MSRWNLVASTTPLSSRSTAGRAGSSWLICRHIDPAVIEADLDRLEREQRDDGGWDVDWAHWSPAGGLEWRGWATVRAVRILRAHGRL